MQLRDVIKKAVKNNDAKLAGQIAVKLRNKGLNYNDIHKFVNKVAPIDPREWEALLHESGASTVIKAENNNPAVVTDLKTMGILPPAESPGNYPEIGKDPTWEKLYEHPTVEAKRDTIATLIKAKRPDLANVVAKMPVKGNPIEARPPDPHEAAMNAAVDAAFKALKKSFRVERNDIFDALDELTTGSER